MATMVQSYGEGDSKPEPEPHPHPEPKPDPKTKTSWDPGSEPKKPRPCVPKPPGAPFLDTLTDDTIPELDKDPRPNPAPGPTKPDMPPKKINSLSSGERGKKDPQPGKPKPVKLSKLEPALFGGKSKNEPGPQPKPGKPDPVPSKPEGGKQHIGPVQPAPKPDTPHPNVPPNRHMKDKDPEQPKPGKPVKVTMPGGPSKPEPKPLPSPPKGPPNRHVDELKDPEPRQPKPGKPEPNQPKPGKPAKDCLDSFARLSGEPVENPKPAGPTGPGAPRPPVEVLVA
jgi:hypothetical protein